MNPRSPRRRRNIRALARASSPHGFLATTLTGEAGPKYIFNILEVSQTSGVRVLTREGRPGAFTSTSPGQGDSARVKDGMSQGKTEGLPSASTGRMAVYYGTLADRPAAFARRATTAIRRLEKVVPACRVQHQGTVRAGTGLESTRRCSQAGGGEGSLLYADGTRSEVVTIRPQEW